MNGRQTLTAQFRTRNSTFRDIPVLDLSAAGCMIDSAALLLRVDDRVMVKLANLEFAPAYVLWVEDGTAAVTFERPLHEAVLDHLQSLLPARPHS